MQQSEKLINLKIHLISVHFPNRGLQFCPTLAPCRKSSRLGIWQLEISPQNPSLRKVRLTVSNRFKVSFGFLQMSSFRNFSQFWSRILPEKKFNLLEPNQAIFFFHQRRNILTPHATKTKKETKKNFRQTKNSRRHSAKRNGTKHQNQEGKKGKRRSLLVR